MVGSVRPCGVVLRRARCDYLCAGLSSAYPAMSDFQCLGDVKILYDFVYLAALSYQTGGGRCVRLELQSMSCIVKSLKRRNQLGDSQSCLGLRQLRR